MKTETRQIWCRRLDALLQYYQQLDDSYTFGRDGFRLFVWIWIAGTAWLIALQNMGIIA